MMSSGFYSQNGRFDSTFLTFDFFDFLLLNSYISEPLCFLFKTIPLFSNCCVLKIKFKNG